MTVRAIRRAMWVGFTAIAAIAIFLACLSTSSTLHVVQWFHHSLQDQILTTTEWRLMTDRGMVVVLRTVTVPIDDETDRRRQSYLEPTFNYASEDFDLSNHLIFELPTLSPTPLIGPENGAVVRQHGWSLNFSSGFLLIAGCLPLAMNVAAVILNKVRLTRLHSKGLCPRCDYDLRATPSRCPECGYNIPPGLETVQSTVETINDVKD